MPTRTQQADISRCAYASHGDTKHVLLFPEDPHECFEHAAAALDLADRLQTPVFVMTDLDIGMNQRLCEPLRLGRRAPLRPRQGDERRGARSRPRLRPLQGRRRRRHPVAHAARHAPDQGRYFTRGTTRDAYARYSETGPDYIYNVQRLLKKFDTAATLVPQPVLRAAAQEDAARRHLLRLDQPGDGRGAGQRWQADGIHLDALRLRAFPFPEPACASSSPRTTTCSSSSRTATRRCASLLINEFEIDPARLIAGAALRRHADHRALHHRRRSPSTCRRAGGRAAAQGKRAHDLHRQTQAAPPDAGHATRSATRAATTKARSARCAPAAATTRSRRRSSRPAGSSTSSRTAWPSCRASAAVSKTPDYFLGASHGFNTVHGRMPSVLTGANLANRDLLYLGVSGDGDSASIGLGQFAHAMRRGVHMVYIVENNGVYGLTKGQFSATADRGSKSKKGALNADAPIDLVGMALQLGATYVARGFSGDKAQLVPLIKGAIAPRRRGLHRRHQPLRGLQQPRRQHEELRLRARAQRGGQPHRLHRPAPRRSRPSRRPARCSSCRSTTAA